MGFNKSTESSVWDKKKQVKKKKKKTVKLTMWLNNEIEELVLVKVIKFDIWLKTKSHFSNPFVVIIAFN